MGTIFILFEFWCFRYHVALVSLIRTIYAITLASELSFFVNFLFSVYKKNDCAFFVVGGGSYLVKIQ